MVLYATCTAIASLGTLQLLWLRAHFRAIRARR